jgi:predicted RNA-binding protein YlxR (DUF448 family)/ribosomal protein L7Ae-like RNA K-turn-binding protein
MKAPHSQQEGSDVEPSDAPAVEQPRGQRTCIGCGQTGEPETMLRLVVSPEGEVAVDLAGGHFGRGAHLHPSPRCLASAPRGLARSFRRPFALTPEALSSIIVEAADRRVTGLLASAARAQRIEIGAEKAGHGFEFGKVRLLVVARDAAAGATTGPVLRAIAGGDAVAWGTKAEIGALVGKSEVAVVGITSEPLAVALRTVVRMASSVATSGGRAPENVLKGARAAED